MSRIKYVNIDARFNSQYCNFPFAEYYIELPERIHHVKSLTIINVDLPMMFYNICDALNNNYFKVTKLTEKEDNYCNKSTIIKIPNGNYSEEAFQKKISDVLKSKNLDDLQIEISSTNMFRISSNKDDYIVDFAVDNMGENDKPNIQSKLGWLLGYRNTAYYIRATSNSSNEKKESEPEKDLMQTICNFYNPRYLYLEVLEYERHNRHNGNHHLFTSSLLGCHISKHIIARITLDYKNYPFGSTLPANFLNGFLISNTRFYKKKIKLEDLKIRLVNEFGIPICLNGFEISLCAQIECEHESEMKPNI